VTAPVPFPRAGRYSAARFARPRQDAPPAPAAANDFAPAAPQNTRLLRIVHSLVSGVMVLVIIIMMLGIVGWL